MRRLPWLSLLLVLPWAAGAADADMLQPPVPPDLSAAVARAEATPHAEPELDLSVEPTLPALPALEDTRVIPALARAKGPEVDAQAPLSFGLALRTRHEVGDEARQHYDEPPGIGEKVEGIVRRSTIGVTGTYRF